MSSRYRRQRYSKSASSLKEGLIKIAFTVFTLIGLVIITFLLWNKNTKLHDQLSNQKVLLSSANDELSILRTLNPYHVGSNEVLEKAVINADLFPGWITRVYPLPENKNKASSMTDLGSFVLNETRFSMSSHKRYGISRPAKSMYRLNGLYPSRSKGRLQVGIEFYLTKDKSSDSKPSMSKICSCYARLEMNKKRVIDKKLNIVTRFSTEQVITGEIELNKGLYPISAMIYCDDRSDFNGDDVEVSISFRTPEQHSLSTSRYSIFHIYSPSNITASL